MAENNTPEAPKKPINWNLIWGIVGAVGTVGTIIGLGFAWWTYQQSRAVKSLSYGVISNGPLVSITDNMNGRLKVSFDGQPVPNVNIAVIRVQNDGNVPIEDTDFKTPVSFGFGASQKGTVLTAEVTATSPGGVQQTLTKDANQVQVKLGLLNPGDNVTLKVIVAGGDQQIGAGGRIVGVRTVRRVDLSADKDVAGINYWVFFLPALFFLALAPLTNLITNKFVNNLESRTPTDEQISAIVKLRAEYRELVPGGEMSKQLNDKLISAAMKKADANALSKIMYDSLGVAPKEPQPEPHKST